MNSPLPRPLPPAKGTADPARQAGSARTGDATQPARTASAAGPSRPSRRLGRQQLTQLADGMPDRERSIVETVDRLRLVRSDQLQRLFFHEISSARGRARVCRRSLQILTDQGIVRRLERRVGGTPAGGSSGYAYTLAPAGRRLIAYWAGEGVPSDRGVHEPQAGFVEHTLAISELYVRLLETERRGGADLIAFEPEPGCWRTHTSPTGATVLLKPDALARLGVGDSELSWFLEVDMGTHGRGALARKLNAYLSYYRTGREQTDSGVFPRIAWITGSDTRAHVLANLITRLPEPAHRLFATTTMENALALLTDRKPDTETRP